MIDDKREKSADSKTRTRSRKRDKSREAAGNTIQGVVRVHARGFGFLTNEGHEDVFIPEGNLKGILDGDEVRLTLIPEGRTGKVVLLKRSRTQVVADVTVTENGQLSLRVDSALGNLTLTGKGKYPVGNAVLVDLPPTGAKAVVLEDLGPARSEPAIIRRILHRHQLPHEPAREGRKSPQTPRLRGRRDLRDMHTITIDDDSSTDLDDALSAAAGPDGSLRIWVHIADVSEHVHPGSLEDQQARACPTSIYLNGYTRHMLPPALASRNLSLIPGQDRDALTVELRLDGEGSIRSVDVYESLIRSNRRISYEQCGKALMGEDAGLGEDDMRLLRLLAAASARLGQMRQVRGGVDAGRIDPEPAGNRGSDSAHLLIERLMVAANESVATWMTDRGLGLLYRVHAAPDSASAAKLETIVDNLGLYGKLPRPVTALSFAALARQAETAGVGAVFWDAAAGVLGRASYQTGPAGHFGLGSTSYTHYTSPLRRYADLLTHRSIKAYLSGEREEDIQEQVLALDDNAQIINSVNRQASAAERDSRATAALLGLKPRQVIQVTVTGYSTKGARVRLDGGPSITVQLGRFARVGERVRMRVRTVDALRGTVELSTQAGNAAPKNRR